MVSTIAPQRGLKHPYEIIDGVVYIYVTNRNKEKFTIKLDEDDFNSIMEQGWGFTASKFGRNYDVVYASTTIYIGDGKYQRLFIHRYITGVPKGIDVDHLNHDTLDNRRCNLVLKDRSKNAKNRIGSNKNTTSGVRNVSWSKNEQKWIVQLQVNGKNKRFGSFPKDKLDEASKLAEKLRKEIYGEIR